MEIVEDCVIPAHWPELRLLCWHIDPYAQMTEAMAFGLYERHWRYIDQALLTEREAQFIERLSQQYGQGVINA